MGSREPAAARVPDVQQMQLAGSAERTPDAALTLNLHTQEVSRVNSLGARAQSCICWTSEAQPAAGAPDPILG